MSHMDKKTHFCGYVIVYSSLLLNKGFIIFIFITPLPYLKILIFRKCKNINPMQKPKIKSFNQLFLHLPYFQCLLTFYLAVLNHLLAKIQ